MKITQASYKNVFAIRLETERYIALVLPSEGGKIASFQNKQSGKEYLVQNPSPTYLHIGMTDDFEKGECSGFDDMFPTIAPVIVDGRDYPDHGEVCRVPFSYEISNETLTLRYHSKTLGYNYIKRFEERANGVICVLYEIENLKEDDLNVLWAGHCLVPMKQGGRVLVPFDENVPVDFIYDSRNAIQTHTRLAYQNAHLRTDWNKGDVYAQKLYFPQQCTKGYIGYQYPEGDSFVMEFDTSVLPYVGVWIDYGVVNGSYYVGLEPCSLGYDTVFNAEKYGQRQPLKKGQRLQFCIALYVDDALPPL